MERVIENVRDYRSFGDFLQSDYKLRQPVEMTEPPKENLSIRRYGQLLGVDASTLSQAMRQQRRLSGRQVQSIGRKLGLGNEELSYLVEIEVDPNGKMETNQTPAFTSINDWRFDAVLEFLNGRSSDYDLQDFASAISETLVRVKDIVAQLMEGGLLSVVDNRWVDTAEHASSIVSPIDTAESARDYQKSLLKTSLEKIDELHPALRNHTSILLQIEESDLPAIIGVLKSTRRALARDFQTPNDASTSSTKKLYALQLSLFPLLETKGSTNA